MPDLVRHRTLMANCAADGGLLIRELPGTVKLWVQFAGTPYGPGGAEPEWGEPHGEWRPREIAVRAGETADFEYPLKNRADDVAASQAMREMYLAQEEGRHAEVLKVATRTLKLENLDPTIRNNLLRSRAMSHWKFGDYSKAADDYESILEFAPRDTSVMFSLVKLLTESPDPSVRNPERAVELAEKMSADPHIDSPYNLTKNQALETLIRAYQASGDSEKARRTLQELMRRLDAEITNATNPESKQTARLRKAELWQKTGDYAQAIRAYEAIVDEAAKNRKSDFATQGILMNNLANLLATAPEDELRDGKRAVELARQAQANLSKRNARYAQKEVLDTLAAAYAEAGDFASAVKTQQQAVQLAPQNAEFRQRLELYEAGKPYRRNLTPNAGSNIVDESGKSSAAEPYFFAVPITTALQRSRLGREDVVAYLNVNAERVLGPEGRSFDLNGEALKPIRNRLTSLAAELPEGTLRVSLDMSSVARSDTARLSEELRIAFYQIGTDAGFADVFATSYWNNNDDYRWQPLTDADETEQREKPIQVGKVSIYPVFNPITKRFVGDVDCVVTLKDRLPLDLESLLPAQDRAAILEALRTMKLPQRKSVRLHAQFKQAEEEGSYEFYSTLSQFKKDSQLHLDAARTFFEAGFDEVLLDLQPGATTIQFRYRSKRWLAIALSGAATISSPQARA